MGLTLIVISILLFGLAGLTLIPALPVVPAQFLIILLFTILSSFSYVSGGQMIVFGVIAILSLLVDYGSGVLGARFGGAHRQSILAGVLGGIFGTIFFPPFGAMLGIPLFVFISESSLKKNRLQSVKSAGYSLLGAIGGIFLNGFLAFTTAVLFLIFVF